MKPKLFLGAVLVAAIIPSLAVAQKTDETVIVTASRISQEQSGAGNVTIITAAEIAQSPARTLPEVLGLEAGVVSRSLYGNQAARATVDIRGFGVTSTQNTLVLLDGRRLNDVDLSAVDFAAIPLQNVERIEIMRGGGSTLYGDGAVGGVINIITKQPGGSGTSGHLTLGAGSFGTLQANASISHSQGPLALQLFADQTKSDGYRDNNELDQTSLQADIRLQHANGEWMLKIDSSEQELELPGPRRVDPTAPVNELESDRTGTGSPNDFANREGMNVTAGYSRFFGEGHELIIDAGIRDKNQTSFFDYGGGFTAFADSDLVTLSITPRARIAHQLMGNDTLTIGLDHYRSEYDSDRAQTKTSAPIHQISLEQISTAAYLHNRSQLGNGDELQFGVRTQKVTLDAKDKLDTSAPGGLFETKAPDMDDSAQETTMEVSARHVLTEQWTWNWNLAQATRFGTVDEIFEFDPGFNRIFSPLDPQTSDLAEVGISFQRGDYRMRTNVYYMKLENEIHFDPVSFTNINLDPTQRYGAEIEADMKATDAVRIKANYTYLRAKFRKGNFKGNDVPVTPRTTAAVSLNWQVNPIFTLSGTVTHVGAKFFDNDQDNDFGQRIPAYEIVDLKLTAVTGPWTISGSIQNALDKEAFDYGVSSTSTAGVYNAYPLPEQAYLVSVTRKF